MTTPTDVLRQAINYTLSTVHTCLPATIVSYNYSEQKADVQPSIDRVYTNGEIVRLPIITDVPVVFPSGTNFFIHWPLNEGDNVMLHFSERSLDNWLSTGGNVIPLDQRKFDLTDAIAVPGLKSFNNSNNVPNNTSFYLENGSSRMQIGNDGTFCMHGLTDELLDLISQIVSQQISFIGANSAGPVILDPTYIASLNLLRTKINAMKGTC